jgi:hypothetical protein
MRRTLSLVLTLLFFPLAFGQTANFASPGTGQEFNNRLVNVFEWILEARFTPAQRGELAELVDAYSRSNNPSDIEALMKVASLNGVIAGLPPEQQAQARSQLQTNLLEQLRQQPSDPTARLLLAVYQSSHSDAQARGGSPARSYNDTPASQKISFSVPASTVPAALVGQWLARRGSGSSYMNPNTGTYGAPNATTDSYTFFADGSYEHAILMQSSLYNCTIRIFGYEKGVATVNGDTLSIQPGPGTLEYNDNCRPHLNSRKATQMDGDRWQWRIAQDEIGTKLCVRDQKGASACYYRK